VRVGNAAAGQTQLGCFGDLLDAVWRYVGNGGCLDPADGAMIAALADRICDLWRSPDAGLCELGDVQPYTISKIGCWVALDRALRLAEAGQPASTRVAGTPSGPAGDLAVQTFCSLGLSFDLVVVVPDGGGGDPLGGLLRRPVHRVATPR